MWFFISIIVIFAAYLSIKYLPSKLGLTGDAHDSARAESTRRIMATEKYHEPVAPVEINKPPKRSDSHSLEIPSHVPDWVFSDGVKRTATNLLIEYQSDEATLRQITALYIGYAYIFAYCHFRQDYRTFRFSSILSAVDPDTGVSISNSKQFLHERSWSEDITAEPEMALEDGVISVKCNLIIKLKAGRTVKTKNVEVLYYSHQTGKIFVRSNDTFNYSMYYLDDIINTVDSDTGDEISGIRSYLRKHRN